MKAIRTIALTGGPCAGKTTLAQMIERVFAKDLLLVPESASLLFHAGFPRWPEIPTCIEAAQRAIYHVQRELELAYATKHPRHVLLLDRGTLDGSIYWPAGPEAFFRTVGTTYETELSRYDLVIYLESAGEEAYLRHRQDNPTRTESWAEAQVLDRKLLAIWSRHPRLTVIRNQVSFQTKLAHAVETLDQALADREF